MKGDKCYSATPSAGKCRMFMGGVGVQCDFSVSEKRNNIALAVISVTLNSLLRHLGS